MRILHHIHIRSHAGSAIPRTAMAVSDSRQQHRLPLTAAGGHRKGKRCVACQIRLHSLALHYKIYCICIMLPFQRKSFQHLLPVLIICLGGDNTIYPVQLQLNGRIHVYAHIGDRNQQHDIPADPKRQHQCGASQLRHTAKQFRDHSPTLSFLFPASLPQEALCGSFQLLACLNGLKSLPDSALCLHHRSPPNVSFNIDRPRDRREYTVFSFLRSSFPISAAE